MATVIDALMVTLGLDPAEFKRGAAQAKKAQADLTVTTKKGAQERERIDRTEQREKTKHFKQSQDQFRKSADSIRHVRNQALATLAVFTGGMGMLMFAKNTMLSAAGMGRLSDNIGLSVKNIAGWQGAIEKMGGSAGDANSLLSAVTNSWAGLKNGQRPDALLTTYMNYGGNKGQAMSGTSGYLMGLSSELQRMYQHSHAQAYQVATQQMGLSPAAFNLLKQGPAAVRRLVTQYGNASGTSRQLAVQSQKLQGELVLLHAKFQKLAIEVMTALMPTIQKLMVQLDHFSTWVNGHGPEINRWIQTAVRDGTKFAEVADRIARALGGWQNALVAIGAMKLAQILRPLAIAGTGVPRIGLAGAAGAGGYALGKDVIDPALNDTLTKLTGHKDTTLGNWLFGAIHGHYNPNALDNGAAMLAVMRARHHIIMGAHGWTRQSNVTTNQSSSETHIGQIGPIITRATDAAGLQAELGPAFGQNNWALQANSGME